MTSDRALFFAVLQVALLCALLLTLPPQPPVTIEFVVPTIGSEYWSFLAQEFQQKNPKIRLEVIKRTSLNFFVQISQTELVFYRVDRL
ncbi:MAG: hypothetical protein KME17_20120 [Cyanosarcina radialis HA8281-LM2]|jgi:ABC-type sugar transport system substrate-binding protein|nr:hypothetical protein [Cyanosarcina radialis HA8281-LM2]